MEYSADTWLCLGAFWFVCGLITGYLNRSKGRSELAGCLVGFLLGPIGVILALITPTNERELDRRENAYREELVRRGKLKKCPYCGEFIKPEATVCRFCTREVVVLQR